MGSVGETEVGVGLGPIVRVWQLPFMFTVPYGQQTPLFRESVGIWQLRQNPLVGLKVAQRGETD